jgi:hypothetical protein
MANAFIAVPFFDSFGFDHKQAIFMSIKPFVWVFGEVQAFLADSQLSSDFVPFA